MGYATRLDGQNLFNLPEGKDSSFVRSFARKARPGERSPTLLRVSDGYTFGLKPKSGTHSPSKSSPTGMRAGSGSRICGDESRFLLRGSMGSPSPTAGSEASPYSTPFGLIPLRARNLLIEPPRKGCNLSWGSSRRERRRVSPPRPDVSKAARFLAGFRDSVLAGFRRSRFRRKRPKIPPEAK